MAAHILVVDDDPLNVKLLRVLLTLDGHRVDTAGSAAEARRAVATEAPDLILMDVSLPDLDGLSLTRELKRVPGLDAVPVVAISAHAAHDADVVRAAGCVELVAKPVDTRGFPARVREWLRRAR